MGIIETGKNAVEIWAEEQDRNIRSLAEENHTTIAGVTGVAHSVEEDIFEDTTETTSALVDDAKKLLSDYVEIVQQAGTSIDDSFEAIMAR
ncbi:hypothetical protein ACQYRI_09665 [Salmonella enterica]